MSRRPGPPERFDAVAVVRSAVRTVRSDAGDGATVTLDAPDRLPVESREAVLRPVVTELVGNAVDHHDGSPRVEVAAAADGDALVVTVTDDGPGIAAAELSAVTAGGETALQHGSGLGLWLATWGADALGGDLSFDDRDPRGTVVTLRIPGVCA